MDDLGVELDPVQAARRILERGDGRLRGRRQRDEPGRRLEHGVAVAHPAALLVGRPGEQAAVLAHFERRAPELADRGPLHPAAQLEHHRLHAVADAEHRDPELEQLAREPGRALGIDRRRAAREDQPAWRARPDLLQGHGVRQELAEYAALAHPPRDQLGVLASEVEYEHLIQTGLHTRTVRRRWSRFPRRNGSSHATGVPTGPPPLSAATGSVADVAARVAPIPIPCSRWSCLPSLCSAGATITSARWKEGMSS